MKERSQQIKTYKMIYWQGYNDEEGKFKEIECLIHYAALDTLLSNTPPKFITVLINDGEQMILPIENINTIKEIFGPNLS